MPDLSALEQQYGLPKGFLSAQMKAESGGNPNAVSPKGALGLFQFMPETAKQYGIDPLDPEQAAVGAARMDADLLRKYNGDTQSALAAYNWGQGNVDRKGLENAPAETKNYISKIMTGIGNAIIPSANAAELPPLPEGFVLASTSPQGQQKPDQNAVTQIPELPPGFVISNDQNTPKTQENQPKTTALQTIVEQGLQGLTAGFGDEIVNPIAAGIVSLTEGTPYSETKDLTDKLTAQRLEGERKDHPGLSLASDIGGQILQLASGAKLLGALSPKSAAALSAFATKNPLKSVALLGGLTGAARGAGDGSDEDSRLSGALSGGIAGAVFAPATILGGRAVLKPVASKLASLGKSALEDVAATNSAASSTASPAANISPLKQSADLFTKTAGESTQNPELQRLENRALAGSITPEAEQAARDVIAKRNTEFEGYLNQLGNGAVRGGRDINGILDDVSSTIKTNADSAKSQVNSAYDMAREGGGVKIGRPEIQQGLWKNVATIRRDGQYDVSQMPLAKSVLQRLARYSKDPENANITAVKLGELENWRKQATNAIASTKDKTERRFLGQIVSSYDNFMENTAANAADIGDAKAITAFRNAVKSRAEYGRLFEKNSLISDIKDGTKSIDDVRQALIGTGAIKGRKAMADNLSAIIKASGKDSAQVQQDLQNVFARNIYQRAQNGLVQGTEDVPLVSPAKLKTELENLFVNQSDFAEKLYGKDAVTKAQQAIKELKLIASKQPKVASSSGSDEGLVRVLMGKIPVFGNVFNGLLQIAEAGAAQREGQQAIKSLGNAKTVSDAPFSPKAKFWVNKATGAITGGVAGSIGTRDGSEKDMPRITITPRRQ